MHDRKLGPKCSTELDWHLKLKFFNLKMIQSILNANEGKLIRYELASTKLARLPKSSIWKYWLNAIIDNYLCIENNLRQFYALIGLNWQIKSNWFAIKFSSRFYIYEQLPLILFCELFCGCNTFSPFTFWLYLPKNCAEMSILFFFIT